MYARQRVAVLRAEVEDLKSRLQAVEEKIAVTVTKRWRSGSEDVVVATKRGEGAGVDPAESAADWKTRHLAAVAEAETQFPPNP